MSTSQATTAPQSFPLFVELPTELQVKILEHAAFADLIPCEHPTAKPPTVRKTLRMFFRTAELLVGKHAGWYERPVRDFFSAMYQEGFRTRIYLMGTSRLARRVALEAWVEDIQETEDEEEDMGQMTETVMGYFEDVLEEVKEGMEGKRPDDSDEDGEGGTDTVALLYDARIKTK